MNLVAVSHIFGVLGLLGFVLALPGLAQTKDLPVEDLPIEAQRRQELRTPPSDKLLYELEKDFVELLGRSKNVPALLQAEDLLEATNDNTHWTNYSQASKLLRGKQDIAAIPLLLRYLVIHHRRSARHVMIPEYIKTISAIAGKELPEQFKDIPGQEEQMREKVEKLVSDWWRPSKATLVTEPANMNSEQLRIVVMKLLDQVRYDGDFKELGGKPESAYDVYHNVTYRMIRNEPYGRPSIAPLHLSMLPIILSQSDARGTRSNNTLPNSGFPYESVIVVSELARNGGEKEVQKFKNDEQQSPLVRLICMLGLYRASYGYDTDLALKLYEKETTIESRLVLLFTLRWADAKAIPTLLALMDDPNQEIATAAACALVDARPPEAVPKFKKILERNHVEPPLLLLDTLGHFQSSEARELLKSLLIEALEGRKNGQHLDRTLYAFTKSWDVPSQVYNQLGNSNYKQQARVVLDYCQARAEKEAAEATLLTAAIESLQTQLRVATQIESLRREEYKRLLRLQGDEVVTAQESQRAQELLKSASSEVESLRTTLRQKQAMLPPTSRD